MRAGGHWHRTRLDPQSTVITGVMPAKTLLWRYRKAILHSRSILVFHSRRINLRLSNCSFWPFKPVSSSDAERAEPCTESNAGNTADHDRGVVESLLIAAVSILSGLRIYK